jgi:hypothetical protein
MKLCYGQPHFADFEELLWAMPDKEFKNLTRSTIPLLSYWADASAALETLCRKLEISVGNGTLCFEFAVKSLGRNKPSFTDIMYISQPVAIAIEAKSTEPQYDTVREWLKRGTDIPTRRKVARHWLAIIEKRTGRHVDDDIVAPLIYQMIHRLASLCSIAAARHVLVFQVFEFEGHTVNYEHSLNELRKALDPERRIGMCLHTIRMEQTSVFHQIKDLLKAARAEDQPFIVRNALLDRSLVQIIGESTISV